MGKVQRIKEEKKEAQQKPTIINTISINLLSDGQVNVSGPIQNPIAIMGILGQAMGVLSRFYAQEAASKIVKPSNGLILPH